MRYVDTEHGPTLELNDNDLRYLMARDRLLVIGQRMRVEGRLRRLREHPPKLPQPEPGTDPMATYFARMQIIREPTDLEGEVERLRIEEEAYTKAIDSLK